MVLINILHCILFAFRIFIFILLHFKNKTPYPSIKLLSVESAKRIFCQVHYNDVQPFRLQVSNFYMKTCFFFCLITNRVFNETKIIYRYYNNNMNCSLLTLFEIIRKCPLCVILKILFYTYRTPNIRCDKLDTDNILCKQFF